MNIEVVDVAGVIAQMSRMEVEREILHFRGRFELDFTRKFLDSQSLEQLHHILLSAVMQEQEHD